MSDPTPPSAPGSGDKPSVKTSSVPLKKETVRITLRAKPNEGGEGAPVPPPTAPLRPVAPPPPVARPAAAAPPPPVGSKTIPLGAPPRPGAPPAPTRPLAVPTAAAAPGAPRPAAPMPTQQMPKPTVKLQPSGPASAPGGAGIQSAPIRVPVAANIADDDDDDGDTGLGIVGIIASVAAAVLLLAVLMGSDKVKLFKKPASDGTYAKRTADLKNWMPDVNKHLPAFRTEEGALIGPGGTTSAPDAK
jgi:hypothetical protein